MHVAPKSHDWMLVEHTTLSKFRKRQAKHPSSRIVYHEVHHPRKPDENCSYVSSPILLSKWSLYFSTLQILSFSMLRAILASTLAVWLGWDLLLNLSLIVGPDHWPCTATLNSRSSPSIFPQVCKLLRTAAAHGRLFLMNCTSSPNCWRLYPNLTSASAARHLACLHFLTNGRTSSIYDSKWG
jgi:hypothetical protein